MSQNQNIYFYHKEEPEISQKLHSLCELASKNGFTVVNNPKDAHIILCFGDDGTFLQAIRKTGFCDNCLYVSVSTSPRAGFYADVPLHDVAKVMDAIKSDKIEVINNPTIEVTVDDQASFYCLNEFSIQSAIVKTFIMDVFIDQLHFETFRGDGLVVSTPTGSTAYNKSVHGAVVDPVIPCMQITELGSLNNNFYRTLGSPFILGENRVLTLIVVKEGNEHPTMAMDNEALSIRHVEKVQIKLSGKTIKTIKLKDNSFWEKVRRNFL
jgi:NAD+ kinase